MNLTRLVLRNFRCFEQLTWEPQPGLNFILGLNAQGKTSILEAACMLLRLKSPRTNVLPEMLRFGQSSFCVEGFSEPHHQKVIVTPDAPKKYQLFLDEVAQSKKDDYLSFGTLVWFENEDLSLIHGPAGRRRDFLDSAGLQLHSAYRSVLRFYERALRSRNLLLREGKPRREVEAYNLPLAESGEQLIALRASLVEALQPHVAASCQALSQEKITLAYQPGATGSLLEALAASRTEEERLHYTQVGPHRDDLLIFLNDLPAGPFASEGQRRTLAIALKLGLASLLHQERSSPPLLLLDDIFGELDATRRHALLNHLPKTSQGFFTTTALTGLELPPGSTSFKLLHSNLSEEF
ncbi:MAG: DNA replication and repair protein RecF [Verrucomicrobiae bacterium]|nr:DNA replication and repair protein RecF [Verrucomicrobiae bacterium]